MRMQARLTELPRKPNIRTKKQTMSTEEERISELLWRTIKLRVSLLFVAVVVLLIVWSGILSGDERAKPVDLEYCRKLVTMTDSELVRMDVKRPVHEADISVTCSEAAARSWIELQRRFNAFYLSGSSGTARQSYLDRAAVLSEYDSKRSASYKFQIQLSSEISSGELYVNALTIAEVVPFVILGLAAMSVVLGFQQRAYRGRLAQLARQEKGAGVFAVVRTQFFTFSGFASKSGSWGARWPVLSVEGVAIWGLVAALVLAFGGLLSSFAENVVHLTDSTVHNYVSELYGFAFLLGFWLLYTRRVYEERLRASAEGTRVRRARLLLERAGEISLVVLALAALFLPWAKTRGGFSLRGYAFVLTEHAGPSAGAHLLFPPANVFPVSPPLFSELRWQLGIALIFIVVCGVEALLRQRFQSTMRGWIRAVRAALATATLYWSLNLLLYMSILEYEAIRGTGVGGHSVLFGLLTGATPGLPLDVYDPSYGFLIFLAASWVLVWPSLRELFAVTRHRLASEIASEPVSANVSGSFKGL